MKSTLFNGGPIHRGERWEDRGMLMVDPEGEQDAYMGAGHLPMWSLGVLRLAQGNLGDNDDGAGYCSSVQLMADTWSR